MQLCVQAAERMYENEIIVTSADSERAVAQLRCDSNTVQAFLTEECSPYVADTKEHGKPIDKRRKKTK